MESRVEAYSQGEPRDGDRNIKLTSICHVARVAVNKRTGVDMHSIGQIIPI